MRQNLIRITRPVFLGAQRYRVTTFGINPIEKYGDAPLPRQTHLGSQPA
jgi:hypothetical protein